MELLLAEWMYLPWQEANRAAAAARGATQGGSQAVLDTHQADQIQVRAGAHCWLHAWLRLDGWHNERRWGLGHSPVLCPC